MAHLEHFEAMNINQLLIELKDLAFSAEEEAIFANHPQLRPDYDFLTHIRQDSKIALRKRVEKSLEITLKMMALLVALDQKKHESDMQRAEKLVVDFATRIQNSTKKIFNLYSNLK